jgi:hypothetical protein
MCSGKKGMHRNSVVTMARTPSSEQTLVMDVLAAVFFSSQTHQYIQYNIKLLLFNAS